VVFFIVNLRQRREKVEKKEGQQQGKKMCSRCGINEVENNGSESTLCFFCKAKDEIAERNNGVMVKG
jgi:ribosomal protein L37AE/L43A